MATNVFMTQDGLKGKASTQDYSSDNLFAGVWRLDQSNLDHYDPFIQGYAQIVWTKLPLFWNKVKGATQLVNNFKYITERNFKSFSGIGNLSLESEEMSHGFAGNALPVATTIKKENTSFTLKHYELAGSPIRELYQFWITGIRDPETGVATYHGALENDSNMIYSMKNHTAELLYIVTDPSFGIQDGGKGIEFACYYTNVFPTTIPQDHLNYSSGDHGLTEVDIEFKGCYHQSRAVNKLAVATMKNYKIDKVMSDWSYTGTANGDAKVDLTNNTGWNGGFPNA